MPKRLQPFAALLVILAVSWPSLVSAQISIKSLLSDYLGSTLNQNTDNKVNSLDYALLIGAPPPTSTPGPVTSGKAVPTFHSIGLYWQPPGASTSQESEVFYRTSDSTTWKKGFSLWFDPVDGEYRGSIVELQPNTTYEIKLQLKNTSTTTSLTAKTWNETFPIDHTNTVPYSESTYIVSESGTSDGYVEYVPESILPEGQANIDVKNASPYNIQVNASYVIIRGFKLTGAQTHGIYLNYAAGVHDVVIEKNEIWYWGSGNNHDAAIYGKRDYTNSSPSLERIIIQRNKMYNPRYGSNNWSTGHPSGPQAIDIWNSHGNNVIRYNEAFSTNGNYFNDIFGAGNNANVGFPGRDSDIYSNKLSHCWDDSIEADGFGLNVRVWGNYLTNCLDFISASPVVKGPAYIWRNVSGIAERSPGEYSTAGLVKTAATSAATYGRIYVFHNTILQPKGASSGLYNGPAYNVWTRNNIFHLNTSSKEVFRNASDLSNNFNYDLYNGSISSAYSGAESNGIKSVPTYAQADLANGFILDASSPGLDSGTPIDNFNDGFTGNGPEMGAYETGKPPLEFGVNAYLNQ